MSRSTRWWNGLGSDLAFAVRTLPKNTSFTVTAVLTLALGIGANTAVFSVVNGVLLRSLPYPSADRIVMVLPRFTGLGIDRGNLSSAELADLATRTTAFARIGLYQNGRRGGTITGGCDRGPCEPQRIDALPITAGVFRVLGFAARRGRVFTDDDDRRGHDGVIVLSDKFWRARYAQDPGIVGRRVTFNGLPHTIVGVMPPRFTLQNADAYIPLALAMDSLAANRGAHNYTGIARLAPGMALASANTQVSSLAARLIGEFPRNYPAQMGFGLSLMPLRDYMVGNARTSLLVLLSAVGLILVFCCVNVASLTLARAEARQQELAVRAALGAGAGRLVRQVLVESLLLAFAGGALGVLAAPVAVRVLLASNPNAIPRTGGIQADGTVLLVTLAIVTLTGLLFGVLPALQAGHADAERTLRDAGRNASGGHARQRIRRTLVVAEIALAAIVMSGAGLVIQSFWRLQHVDPGLQPDHVVTFNLELPEATYPDSMAPARLYQRLTERLDAMHGVRAAALARQLPTFGNSNWDIEIEGQPQAPGAAAPSPALQFATPGYLAVLAIPLREGRALDDRDDGRSGLAAVVNEAMAHRFWPTGAVGKRFRIAGSPPNPWFTIVGVMGDVRTEGPSVPAPPQWIGTVAEMAGQGEASRNMWLLLRATGDPTSLVPAVRRELWALDPALNFGSIQTMSAVLDDAVASQRFTTLLLACFAALAVTLAAIGVYGILSFTVTQRRRELGIRVALGARSGDVVRLVVAQGLGLALGGVAVGLVGALGLSRFVEGLLFDTPPRDPATFAAIAVLLVAVAGVASWIPARRGAAVDPVVVLRDT